MGFALREVLIHCQRAAAHGLGPPPAQRYRRPDQEKDGDADEIANAKTAGRRVDRQRGGRAEHARE